MIERYDVYRHVHLDLGFDTNHGKDIVVVYLKLGHKLNGHDKIAHGGIVSLLIDEGLGWAAYESLVHHTGQISKEFTIENTLLVNANLDIDFRSPFMAGSKAVIRVCLDEDRTTGRLQNWKVWMDLSFLRRQQVCFFVCLKRRCCLPPNKCSGRTRDPVRVNQYSTGRSALDEWNVYYIPCLRVCRC